ncbi:MAG: MFS transporter [Clostridiales bacterium]|jgi:MFS family permease|nr:MFS transporter [Clostridiales bacterium]
MEQTHKPGVSARLLFFVTAWFWCAQYSYTQFINPELEAMGMNAAFMGLVAGAYGFTQMLLRIPLGMLADRIGKQKPFVIIGCLLTALAGASFLLSYTPNGFLFARALAGVASASWVSFTVLYSSYFPHAQGPSRIAQLNAANMSGRLIGFFLIIFIIPLLGTKSAFTFSFICGLVALALCLPVKDSQHQRRGITLKTMLQVARDPYLLACSFIGILVQMVAFSTYYGFTINVAKNLGAEGAMLSWLNIVLLVPTLIMNYLVTSRLLARFGGRILVVAGFLIAAVYCFLVPYAQNLTQLFLLNILAGFASTLTFAVLMGQSVRDIPQPLRAVGMGFYQAVYGIGMTVGPILMGLVIDKSGMGQAFWMMALLCLASALLSFRLLGIPPKTIEQ